MAQTHLGARLIPPSPSSTEKVLRRRNEAAPAGTAFGKTAVAACCWSLLNLSAVGLRVASMRNSTVLVAAPTESPYRWLMLALVCFLYFSFGLVSASLAPLLTNIQDDLQISDALTG